MYATGIIKDLDFINAAQARGIIAWDGGVKYKGERVEALKESRWKSFDVFTDWLKDPATDQAVVAALKQEIAECWVISPIYRSQELEDYVNELKLENERLKKALLEMKDAAETWKELAESMDRCHKQRGSKEDYVRLVTYYEANRKESKPSWILGTRQAL